MTTTFQRAMAAFASIALFAVSFTAVISLPADPAMAAVAAPLLA